MTVHALSPTEVETYRLEGYLVHPRVFGREDLESVDRAIQEITRRGMETHPDLRTHILELEPGTVDGQPVPRRIYHPYEQHPAFRAIAEDSRLLNRVASLIGTDLALQHSKLNMKPARVGSVVEWHQDLAYFPHTNDDLVTALIYLDDATEENGCLQVLPRRQHQFLNHSLPDGSFAGMITECLDSDQVGPPTPLPAPAGSIILMHCLLPHSSLPNRSPRPRRTLIFEYRAADAYPIYYGEKTAKDEAHTRHLRGSRSTTARFGGPPPLIPRMPERMVSLYQLQEDTRARLTRQER